MYIARESNDVDINDDDEDSDSESNFSEEGTVKESSVSKEEKEEKEENEAINEGIDDIHNIPFRSPLKTDFHKASELEQGPTPETEKISVTIAPSI